MVARPRHLTSSAAPLAVVFAALILYASWYPFSGWHWPPGQSLVSLLALPWPPWRDAFDMWVNLLGYLPWGLLLMVALQRRGLGSVGALLCVLALSAAMSFMAEVVQNFLPGRHPSLKDCAMNTLGALLGAGLGSVLQGMGALGRWSTARERWFVDRSGGALALLTMWPVGLLFPAPVPLGLGQVGERLRESLESLLHDVSWAAPAHALVAAPAAAALPLRPLAEGLVTALGLLAPCLLAYAIARPGIRRLVLAAGATAMAFVAMTLSTLLNFGPSHALAWIAPATVPALIGGACAAAALAAIPRRVALGLGLVVLTALVALVAQAPADPYFAQSLQAWEQGKFVHFHGLGQWVGWLWPYAAILWMLAQIGRREP